MKVLMSAFAGFLLVSAVFMGVGLGDGPAQEDASGAAFGTGSKEPAPQEEEIDLPGWLSSEARALITMSMRAGEEGPNEYQEGDNGDCLDFNALYLVGATDSPLAAIVEVEPETGYVVDSSAGAAHIDFRNDDGDNLGYNEHETNGNVPEGATYGIVCIALTNGYPDVPEPFATWFFMDGFPSF